MKSKAIVIVGFVALTVMLGLCKFAILPISVAHADRHEAPNTDPVFSRHTQPEWEEIAESILNTTGFETPKGEDYRWTITPLSDWKTGRTVQIRADYGPPSYTYGKSGQQPACFIVFDPNDGNRLISLRFPEIEDIGTAGHFLKSLSKEELEAVLADPKWKEAAEAFLRSYPAKEGKLTFRERCIVDAWGFNDDFICVEVVAVTSNGEVHQVLINPDTMKAHQYYLWESKEKYMGNNEF